MVYLKLILFAVSALVLIRFWVKKRYSHFKQRNIPYVEPIFPFGNLKGVGSEMHANDLFTKLYNELKNKGPISGVFFFFTPQVLVTNLDVIKDILIKNFDSFHNRGTYFNEKDDPLSASLFTIEDQEWKSMRTKLTPTFTTGKMKMMFQVVVDVSNIMMEEFNKDLNHDNIEVKEFFAKFTTDVIGNVAFGLELNSIKNPNSEFYKMGRKVFGNPSPLFFMKMFFLQTYKSFSKRMGLKFFPSDVSDFFIQNIRQTIKYRTENNIERNDFLDLLLKLYKKGEMTFNEVAAQCFLFFFAGFDTSSSTSAFALYCLALNQDVQDRLRDEIKTIMKNHDGELTYEAMNEMKYLQMVIDGEYDKFFIYSFLILYLIILRNVENVWTSGTIASSCFERLSSAKY
jgi:cytochrome P450 family 6